MIRTAGLLLMILFLTGCATNLTEAGRKIKIIDGTRIEAVADCVQSGIVTGKTRTFLTNLEYGVYYATNDARNKAAQIPGADTLVITDSRSRSFGGQVTGIAYDCINAPSQPIRKVPPLTVPKDDTLEKSRKCQAKGGIWLNQQCIISIE